MQNFTMITTDKVIISNTNCRIPLLAIVGCTASGKTALAIELARRICGEIVICDSMQVYAGMEIGTAAPTDEERNAVPHHLVGIRDPMSPYSAQDYVKDASDAVVDISKRGRVPVLCGGTGLYLDAFLRGGYPEDGVPDPTIRRDLLDRLEKEGPQSLYETLSALDPEAAAATHPNNVKRVLRALEIYYTTGETKSERDRRTLENPSPYRALVIGLGYHHRDTLYARINDRVDRMLASGLVQETLRLDRAGVFEANQTAAQAIGYKEILGAVRGQAPLEEAVETLKQATRRYAKRQLTWFSAKDYVRWIYADDEDGHPVPFETILDSALALVGPFLQHS